METNSKTEAVDYSSYREKSDNIVYIPLSINKGIKVTLETKKEKPFTWEDFKDSRAATLAEEEAQQDSYSISRLERIRSTYLDETIRPLFERSYYLGIIANIKGGFISKLGFSIMLILLGWDKCVSSYFVVSGLAVILETANKSRISKSFKKSLIENVVTQLYYLIIVLALVHVCRLLDFRMGETEIGIRNLALAFFAVVNFLTLVKTSEELGVKMPLGIKKITKFFK
jgi:phage-related holin